MSKLRLWRTFGLVCVVCAVSAARSSAQTFRSLVSFDGADGENPYTMTPVQGLDGNLYGTTPDGGASGGGTVFKITPQGTLTTLYSFCSQAGCTDGEYPEAGLVLATDGNFYGTTEMGGANGAGTFFRITDSGALTVLYSFCGELYCGESQYPAAGLVQAIDGNFYGTAGGGLFDYGTVYKITPEGALTTLYSFNVGLGKLGFEPAAGVIQAADGNFYGTTTEGGKYSEGTIFKMTPEGVLITIYSFCSQTNCTDGNSPYSRLVQDADGNLYGTTHNGGTSGLPGDGTVFKITPEGVLTTLYSFNGPDGETPTGELALATDGNLYGMTIAGGTYGFGTVFELTPAGALTTVHTFTDGRGAYPDGGLVQATGGNFYGTTFEGGTSDNCEYGCGTVFSLGVGLGPFVKTLPTFGPVGAKVRILGNDLTGATGVTFAGTAAQFTVVSSSEIETTVPAGAASGFVVVTTPHGALSSNTEFRVP